MSICLKTQSIGFRDQNGDIKYIEAFQTEELNRVKAVEAKTEDLENRVSAIEESGGGGSTPDLTELRSKVSNLETSVVSLNNEMSAVKGDTAAINEQLTANGTKFRFGVTSDGQYGYIINKDGADTVIPFNSGNGENFDYLPILYIRGTKATSTFLIDVEDINTLYYLQLFAASTMIIYGYTNYDWDDAGGNSDKTEIIKITKVDTNMFLSNSIDVSKYKVVEIVMGDNWCGTAFALDNGKYFKKIRMTSIKGWDEMNILVPSNKILKCTALDTTKAVILEQRAQYRLNGGYGHKSTGYELKSLTNVGQSGLYPSERQYGRYIWISGNTTSAAGAYSADIELVNFDKENLTYLFMDYTNSIENTSYRTLSITNNLELSLQRTQTTSCTATWWEQTPIDLTNYNSIEFEITMNQPGDSSKLYDNIIGVRKYYPGEEVQAGEMLPSFHTEPISNYDVNYDKYILLGNDVFEKKKITLDVSDIQGNNFLKITAGNAGFIVHSIKLKK